MPHTIKERTNQFTFSESHKKDQNLQFIILKNKIYSFQLDLIATDLIALNNAQREFLESPLDSVLSVDLYPKKKYLI